MKTILVISLLCIAGLVHAQSRTIGRMVVPIGYEPYDSLRMGYKQSSISKYVIMESAVQIIRCNTGRLFP